MRVFSIDVGTVNVGWACGSAGNDRPSHGVYNPMRVGKNIGLLLADFRAWLTAEKVRRQFTHLVFCSPLIVPGNNAWTIRKINALAGHIELFAYDNELVVEEIAEGKARKHFLAPHKIPQGSKAIKDAVVARCRQLGWQPEMDDDADALCLLDYTLAVKDSPLLRKIAELL